MFGGFGHQIDVSQLLKRPTQVLAVPNISRGHAISSNNAGFSATFELPFGIRTLGVSGNEADRTS